MTFLFGITIECFQIQSGSGCKRVMVYLTLLLTRHKHDDGNPLRMVGRIEIALANFVVKYLHD